MKSFFRLLTLAVTCLASHSAYAIIQPKPGSFAVSGEYIYFHPIYNQSYFAINNHESPDNVGINGTRFDNPLNYQSGYRLEGLYAFCNGCSDLDVRWTYLNSNNNVRNVAGPFLSVGTNGFTSVFSYDGIANSTIDLRFYAIDALYGQRLYDCCCFDLKLQGGLHYANLKFNEDLFYAGFASFGAPFQRADRVRVNFWGIGPELALDMHYGLPSCVTGGCFPLSFVGNARGALLVSQSNTSYRSIENDTTSSSNYDFNNENLWMIVPMWDIRVGLGADFCFSCMTANLEIGFEMLRYEQAIQTQNPIVYDAVMADDYSSLGFYGPYIALGFSF